MAHPYVTFCDDFYVTMRLASQMPLPQSRDTVLHFLEQVRKGFPGLTRFRRSDSGDINVEEDRQSNSYRWISLESKRVSSGHVNPESVADAMALHARLLQIAPHQLGVSPIEIDSLDIIFGFDLEFNGNHDEIIAESVLAESPLTCLLEAAGAKPVDFQPTVTVALSDDCRLQARVDVVTRTNSYQVRTGEYSDDVISVYLTLRRYWGDRPKKSLEEIAQQLSEQAESIAQSLVAPRILVPIRAAISSRS